MTIYVSPFSRTLQHCSHPLGDPSAPQVVTRIQYRVTVKAFLDSELELLDVLGRSAVEALYMLFLT
jgi:hypothetical protein